MNLQKITEEIKREVRNGADANTEPEVHGFDYLYRKETIDRLVDNVALRAYKQALLDVRDECVVEEKPILKEDLNYGDTMNPKQSGERKMVWNSARRATIEKMDRFIGTIETGV